MTNEAQSSGIESDELCRVLQELLPASRGRASRIARLDRRPSPYGSSFPLEELTAYFDDSSQLDLIFKNAHPWSLSPAGRLAKPEFLDDPLREIELYRSVLDSRALGTAFCYGIVAQPSANRYWLFLEKVAGTELYQVGDFDLWRQAARWLARLHDRFANFHSLPSAVKSRLVRHDAAYYERWLERAVSFSDAPLLRRLAQWYPQLVSELTALPSTLIHGEFYASNILVQRTQAATRVCAVDWERAAWGPSLIDLAALTAGKWSETEKADLAAEYYTTQRSLLTTSPDWSAFFRALQCCRLHLAVQWLGWSRDWSPPREQRQNWLAEAEGTARRLGF